MAKPNYAHQTQKAVKDMIEANAFAIQAYNAAKQLDITFDHGGSQNFTAVTRIRGIDGEISYTEDALPATAHMELDIRYTPQNESRNVNDSTINGQTIEAQMRDAHNQEMQRIFSRRDQIMVDYNIAEQSYLDGHSQNDYTKIEDGLRGMVNSGNVLNNSLEAITVKVDGRELRDGAEAYGRAIAKALEVYGLTTDGRVSDQGSRRESDDQTDNALMNLKKAHDYLTQVVEAVDHMNNSTPNTEPSPLDRNIEMYVTTDANVVAASESQKIPLDVKTAALAKHFEGANPSNVAELNNYQPTIEAGKKKRKFGILGFLTLAYMYSKV